MDVYRDIKNSFEGKFNGVYAVLVSLLLLNNTLTLAFSHTDLSIKPIAFRTAKSLHQHSIENTSLRLSVKRWPQRFSFARRQLSKFSGRAVLKRHERLSTPNILISVLRTRRSISIMDSNLMEKQIKLISQAVLDMQYRANDTYSYYCHRQRDQIPKDAYPSCDDFAQTFAQYFGLPEIVHIILDPTSPRVNEDLAIALNKGLRSMTQYKHIINHVYKMEHRVVCTLYTLGGKPCPSHTCPEGEIHHPNRFLCEIEKVSQRIEAFLATLKYVMQNLNVLIDASTINGSPFSPPKIDTESARMAYTFAAMYRLLHQSHKLNYDSVIEAV